MCISVMDFSEVSNDFWKGREGGIDLIDISPSSRGGSKDFKNETKK